MMNFNLVGKLVSILISSIVLFSFVDKDDSPYVIVLGVAQDGGAPHAACIKECCSLKWNNPNLHNRVSSIGIVDPKTKEVWMIDATPDFTNQLHTLSNNQQFSLKGIFLTHAHIGHYSGLMYFGKEAMNASEISVFAMPRMKEFLYKNGPWSLLVENSNISVINLNHNQAIELSHHLIVTPIEVPHRDEFSETVGYKIQGPNRSALFIPDIDKWSKWNLDLENVISTVDYAFIDGTFYDGVEINHRDISQIPHPFIIETLELLSEISDREKEKVHFIHFNHTNPVLKKDSRVKAKIEDAGFKVAQYGARIAL